MEKIKELLKSKKVIVGLVAVLGIATVGTVFALNQPQQPKETVQEEMSDEAHAKLMASIKSMQEADAQAKLKAEEEKKQAEEKAKQEAEAKAKEEAEKTQNEETQTKENTTASSNTNSNSSNTSVTSNNTTPVVTKPVTPTVAPKPQPKPTEPKPVEKPKPIKYCNYTGNRKMVHNICNNGSPWATTPTGWKETDYAVKVWVQKVTSGIIDKVVFKQETERHHLITDDELREGLKNATDPMAECYIGGTCRGFKLGR